jgi:uncharacterized protein
MAGAWELGFGLAFAVGWPLWDYFVEWPGLLKRLKVDPRGGRLREYRHAIVAQWAMASVAAWLWWRRDGAWAAFGLRAHAQWWLAGVLVFLAALAGVQIANYFNVRRSEKVRELVRKSIGFVEPLVPHRAEEMRWFVAVSLTAGICEEFLYRGYLIWAVGSYVGWWGGVVFSVVAFAVVHAYQGRRGILTAGTLGVLLAAVVALTGSLVPAMAVHAWVDFGSGMISWGALRED